MRITREMVLSAEECSGMQVSPDDEELVIIHVVPKGDYEQPVCCFSLLRRVWLPKSQDSYWSYWDSMMMLAQIQLFTNEKTLELLEELGAFDCPCIGFDEEDNK